MARCSKCGREMPVGAVVCGYCGARKKPAGVIVIAILYFIGAFFAFISLFGAIASAMEPSGAIMLLHWLVSLGLLIYCGVGLLTLNLTARNVCIGFSIYNITFTIIRTAISMTGGFSDMAASLPPEAFDVMDKEALNVFNTFIYSVVIVVAVMVVGFHLFVIFYLLSKKRYFVVERGFKAPQPIIGPVSIKTEDSVPVAVIQDVKPVPVQNGEKTVEPDVKKAERPLAYLVVKEGQRIGHSFQLSGEVTSIGSSVSSDVVISDDAVSEKHARILFEEGKYLVYDLASANGTIVNGQPIIRREIVDGDEIILGNTKLVFKTV